MLQKEIESTTRSEIRLKNGIVDRGASPTASARCVAARCAPASSTRSRSGATTPLRRPTREVYTAVLPALAHHQRHAGRNLSPYRRIGSDARQAQAILRHRQRRHAGGAGQHADVQHDARPAAIAAQQEADPTAARSEWDAQFRDDIAGFLDDELIERAVDRDRPLELPPRAGVFYKAYVDASGGAVGGDAYCIAIAHREDGCYVLDVVRGRAGPFDPEELTEEYAAIVQAISLPRRDRRQVRPRVGVERVAQMRDRLHACRAHRLRDLS